MLYLIKLGESTYKVRVQDGIRQVMIKGSWIECGKFVDWLADAGKWDEVAQLATLGERILKGEAV